MGKSDGKSILAVLAGFVFVVFISIDMDFLLTKMGLMKKPFDENPVWFILSVVAYRSGFSTAGAYITAKLAPSNPMQHAMIGGAIGFVLSIVGAITMWDTPPQWYPVALVVMALPCAWLGGKLGISRNRALSPGRAKHNS